MLTNAALRQRRIPWHAYLALVLAFGPVFLSVTARHAGAQEAPSCPCSIWSSSTVPAVANESDTRSVNVGVKFRSDLDGFITAIRFYKGPLNTGTHVASLWTSGGTLLARATFTSETTSGWQQVALPTPAAISANTVYVASYLAPVGRYSITQNYFTTGVDNPPLHALANSVSRNGVFRYSATSAFPNRSSNSSNYWVDVVFTPNQTDTTPPTVASTSPVNAATGVAAGANITATFSEPLDPSSVTGASFELRDQNATPVPAAVGYSAATGVATLNPTSDLPAGTSYTARLRSGPTGIKDLSGNPLATDEVWFFKTGGADSTPPSVTGFTPANGATGVATSTVVTATFAEAMTATTVNASSFTVTGPAGEVAATVAYDAPSKQARLTPADPLAAGTVYVARVVGGASGVKDLAGLALPADVTWSFTTAGTDATPPSVVSSTPPNGATGVSVDTIVAATFSEPMDPTTVNGSAVELRNPDSTLVAALVEYNPTTRTATLTPTNLLAPGATYTATIRGGTTDPRVKDAAGNALASSFVWSFQTGQATQCTSNPIVCENRKPGHPPAEWDIAGAGDDHIQGFATDISVNKGEPVRFKINSTASAYRLDIYRMGYYAGNGARRVATVRPTIALPQSQPACLTVATTGLIDCGNWTESVSWPVPLDATSGIYFAKLVTEAGPAGQSHIVFVVRDDAGQAPILFQTADTTWQAYNQSGGNSLFGGNSLYVGQPAGRAFKVSYNRPFTTRGSSPEDWVFNAEYPMVRWLEANGYHVSYWTGVDSDRLGAQLLQHRVFLSVGHDEYWSGDQRANVEAARNAGVHLAFFSGNEVFWKTRWENSIDGSNTPYRTLVSYKETHANDKIDPSPAWTGTWRDPRFSPPSDGGRPENSLTGTLFTVNDGSTTAITVPEPDGKLRLWRNTSVATLAPGATATMPQGTLGYEWDEDVDNGARPAGLFQLSSTTVNVASKLQDFGSTYAAGTATHSLTLYRHASGALVFGAGTVQWSWGLDSEHDRGSTPPDLRMQQATVNLLADMGVQPATLQAGLVPAAASTDASAPVSSITSPEAAASVTVGEQVVISGTASDSGGGRVAAVEVSVDNGTTWRRATGRGPWTFSWTPTASGSATLKSRAVDDSGNLGAPSPDVTVTVAAGGTCPCTLFTSSATPAVITDPDVAAVELGVKFSSSLDGSITAVRFYKGPQNTGTHIGKLWTSTGQLLASVTFTSETASGWQQASFPTPVAITAGVTYVASYHTTTGRYSVTENYFATAGVDRGPLHAPANTVTPNGVYAYGPGGFPTSSFAATNYWVDVVFVSGAAPPDTAPPTITATSPAEGASGVDVTTSVTATFSEPMDPSTITTSTFELRGPGNTPVPASVSYDSTTRVATLTPTSPLAASTTYVAAVLGGSTDPRAKDLAGNALASSFSWSFSTSAGSPPPSTCPCTIWAPTTTPSVASFNDSSAVELGVKFRSDLDGFVTGIRFFKGSANTGTHVGNLWSISGELLGSVTFTGETASGWQQANFTTPIPISANTTYVASYHTTVGFYAIDSAYFASAGTDRPPLHAVASTTSPNGVFQYGPGGFPTQSFNATNYWVDVVFNTTATIPPDTTPPTVATVRPSSGTGGIAPGMTVAITFSEAMDPTTIGAASIQLRGPGNVVVSSSVSYDDASRTATLDPAGSLAASTTYTLTVRGGDTDPRVKDLAGNALAAHFTSSFSTATNTAPPPLGQGPGGPLLVITTPENKFSTYYSEILYAEGLNLFAVDDASAITSAGLSAFDVVILGEMPLTAAQAATLTDWVNNGGNLIAMRPDKQLAPLLGLSDTNTTLSGGYLLVDTSTPPGEGIVGQTMQFHGTADRYTVIDATVVARLYSSATAATANPAVTLRGVGALGGHAAAFTFDLARSIVYTRQGNPAWAGDERDGVAPVRPDDLYFGAASTDPQPDWIDLNKVAIPQADEQQRLLANLIGLMNASRKPLPRFWYLPRDLKAVVIMTGDDHANGGTAGRFEQYLAASAPGCDVDNWECVRGTSYVYVSSALSDAQAARYHALGFEIGLHVLTGCADWTPSSLAVFYADQLTEFRAAYPSIPSPTTNRTHCIAWSDWATQAVIEANHSIGLDTNYYYWPPEWVADRAGLFTGSAMPMRFAMPDGTLIDVYQATTQMTDESGQSYPATSNALLDRALGPEGYYGVFTANMHTDLISSPGSDAIVASAKARGVPIVTSRQLLEWLDGRNGSFFDSITWNGVALTFSVEVGVGANGLRAMVPAQFAGRALTGLSLNGAPLEFTLRTVKGVQWATFPAAPGTYQATYP